MYIKYNKTARFMHYFKLSHILAPINYIRNTIFED